MNKFLLLAFSSLILTILFVLIFQYIMQLRSQKGALQVTSSPESKVYLNGEYIGQTPLCKCDNNDMLKVGDYTIRLVPLKGGLSEFQEKITVSGSVLTVVDRKFAKDALSEGSVISLSPLPDKKKAELVVASLPEGANVFLDSNEIGKTPVSFNNPTESDHILKINKNGYKEKTVRIRTLGGYKLTVVAYLAADDQMTDQTASASASILDATPTPPAGKKVLILDTPTGFLRVRETVGGTEIGRVTPGESYELVDEQSAWVKIKLKDGAEGWISSDYIKKQ
ncbi:PEGA domain-containing protein [Candidatus Roizmanbacteria bacterium]|nr:PEGA domain-containing protein [Candidatus Roizmanbacteria bacterium]